MAKPSAVRVAAALQTLAKKRQTAKRPGLTEHLLTLRARGAFAAAKPTPKRTPAA